LKGLPLLDEKEGVAGWLDFRTGGGEFAAEEKTNLARSQRLWLVCTRQKFGDDASEADA
jgi:hypothetical protein